MSTVYVLAHFDDEYGALPLLLQDRREGRRPWLLYVADYADPAVSARRLSETRALIARLGLSPDRVLHVGASTGVLDGAVHENLPRAHTALSCALSPVGEVERFVIAAWEGGHQDHDACAVLTLAQARSFDSAPRIEQFSLYNGRKLPGRLFQACAPIVENGPRRTVRMNLKDWLTYATSVRFFPSQAKTWAGLWPMMFIGFLLRGGYHYQTFDPARINARPHTGPLLYERMFKTSYADVRKRLDTFLADL